MSSSEPQLCSNCGNTATVRCTKCEMSATYYCDDVCQKAHETEHKTTCGMDETEKKIYRACSLFQMVYFKFREETYDHYIVDLEQRGNMLRISTGPTLDAYESLIWVYIENDQDKEMILSTDMCGEPLGYLGDFLKELLGDLPITVEECQVSIATKERRAVRLPGGKEQLSDFWPSADHNIGILRTTDHSKTYVLDTTGPQFGIFSPCIDFNQYWEKYIFDVSISYPLGTNRRFYKAVAQNEGWRAFRARITWDAVQIFDSAVASWKKDSGLSLSQLLCQSDHEFIKHRKSLLGTVGTALAEHVRTADLEDDIYDAAVFDKENPGEGDEKFAQLDAQIIQGGKEIDPPENSEPPEFPEDGPIRFVRA